MFSTMLAPSITGRVQVAQTLVEVGDWQPKPGSFGYRSHRSGTSITRSTGYTSTPVISHVEKGDHAQSHCQTHRLHVAASWASAQPPPIIT
jgi:hypothetical protein